MPIGGRPAEPRVGPARGQHLPDSRKSLQMQTTEQQGFGGFASSGSLLPSDLLLLPPSGPLPA